MKKSRETSPTARKVAKDVFTIPNLISVTGATLAIHGSEKIDTAEGLAECAVGRLADVLDGKVARMTGQTSNFGAALDATTDKIVMAKILYELHKKKEIVPEEALVFIAASNLVNAIATGIANLRSDEKAETRPTKSGKLAMAGETVTLMSYIAAHIAEQNKNPKLAEILHKLGAGAFAASLPFAVHATHTYIKRAINGNTEKEKPKESHQITDVNR
ncbi:hypothetical protein EUA67_00060 [TM7 phylum sp. oral taxon 352]|jgi:Phosphatidylglycerophosphate synthase|nr:hypothetical protein EUA67_00060 [TM7 phylum sp. oral taxon 352]